MSTFKEGMGNKQAALGNFVVAAIIFTIVFLIPLYLGLAIAVGLVYSDDIGIWNSITDPLGTISNFLILVDYYLENRKDYDLSGFSLKLLAPSFSGFAASCFFLFLFRAPLMDFRPFSKKESLHGDAKWGSMRDAKKAGIAKKDGFLLGKKGSGSNYYMMDDFQHVLLFAPTGSGKGVGFVIPNLLFWKESVIVHDIKLENYELTSGYRAKMGQDVFLWNPADPEGYTHCYNPLDWISDKPGQMVDDAQKICSLLVEEQEFWENEARSLLLGIILYLVAVDEKPTTFGEVVRTLRSDDVVYNLAVVLDTLGSKIHQVSYMNIAAFLQKADKERSGVLSTANSKLELWANPLIDTATGSSDFDMQQLKKRKMSVYVGVSPDNLMRLQPLLKVFYQQATDFLTRKIPGPDEPNGVMIMMDEFPSLGEMEQFKIGIAYFRGYRVKLFLIVQDTEQLKDIYEEAGMNAFLSNSYYRITFSANNYETANMISQLVGNKTVGQVSHNKPKFLDLNPASRTLNIAETSRALLLPQEIIQLPNDEQIVLVESSPPFKCKKIFYYKDKFFKKRLLPKTYVPTQEPYDPRKKERVEKEKLEAKEKEEKEKLEAASKPKPELIEETKPEPAPTPIPEAAPEPKPTPAPATKIEEPKPVQKTSSSAALPVAAPEDDDDDESTEPVASPFDTPIPIPEEEDIEIEEEVVAEPVIEEKIEKVEEKVEEVVEEIIEEEKIDPFDAPIPPPPAKKKKKGNPLDEE